VAQADLNSCLRLELRPLTILPNLVHSSGVPHILARPDVDRVEFHWRLALSIPQSVSKTSIKGLLASYFAVQGANPVELSQQQREELAGLYGQCAATEDRQRQFKMFRLPKDVIISVITYGCESRVLCLSHRVLVRVWFCGKDEQQRERKGDACLFSELTVLAEPKIAIYND
jgi:hypothetical protein